MLIYSSTVYKYLLKSLIMNVSGHIFFENVFRDHPHTGCQLIKMSQKRLRLRQCIHEDNDVLPAIEEYQTMFEDALKYVRHHSQQPLAYQPYFAWTIDDEVHKSTCWYFESIMLKTCKSAYLQRKAIKHIKDDELKEASKLLASAIELHNDILNRDLVHWSWKEPGENFKEVLSQWHSSQSAILETRKGLCLYQKALEKSDVKSKSLRKLAYKIDNIGQKALLLWPDLGKDNECKIARAMAVIHEAELLWETEEKGTAIALAQEWMPAMQYIQSQWAPKCKEKLNSFGDTLQSWTSQNNTVYFSGINQDLLTNKRETILNQGLSPNHHTDET